MKKMMLRKLGKPVPKPPTGVRSAPPPLPAPDSSSASSLVPTTEKQFDQLINVVKVHLKPSFTPQELVSFLKSRIRHHPALTHLDFHLFRYAATLDTFRHDHNTFEWMTRSLATSDRFDSLNVLVQFMASNPCPCSDDTLATETWRSNSDEGLLTIMSWHPKFLRSIPGEEVILSLDWTSCLLELLALENETYSIRCSLD